MALDENRDEQPRWIRANGLLVAAGIVLLGILPGAGYFHWRAPEVRAEIKARLAAAPEDAGERLDIWMRIGEPQIQGRLTALRFSGRYPWLVTHTVEDAGGAPEIWGLDFNSHEPAEVLRKGLRVELRFPAPSLLGHGLLAGDNADRVPSYPDHASVPDASERAAELLHWFLGKIVEALPEDIPGAQLAIVVAPFDPED